MTGCELNSHSGLIHTQQPFESFEGFYRSGDIRVEVYHRLIAGLVNNL